MTPSRIIVLLSILLMVTAANKNLFNETLSQMLANYSSIILCPPKPINDWSCWLCKQTPQPLYMKIFENPQTGVRAAVGYLPATNKIVVIWRATNNPQNVIQDIAAIPVPYPRCQGCLIHAGFYSAYLSIKAQVQPYVLTLQLMHPGSTVMVTGVSLGGALSVISALELQAQQRKVTQLYNYGAPRVGNAAFADYVNKMIPTRYRIVYQNDPVPRLPTRLMGFKHNSNEVYYTDKFSKLKVCDDSGQDGSCSIKVPPLKLKVMDHVAYAHFDLVCK